MRPPATPPPSLVLLLALVALVLGLPAAARAQGEVDAPPAASTAAPGAQEGGATAEPEAGAARARANGAQGDGGQDDGTQGDGTQDDGTQGDGTQDDGTQDDGAPEQGAQAPPREELPIVLGIRVEGARRWRESQLVATLGQAVGEPLRLGMLESGIQLLWKAFHVRADVAVREVEGGVELQLVVEEMPVDLEPRFTGNDAIDRGELLEWAQLSDRAELFVHQAPRVRQRLLEHYHEEGYYHAEIDVVERPAEAGREGLADLIFDIREGPRVRVRNVYMRGNSSLPDTGRFFWKDGLRHLARVELETNKKLRWWLPLDWLNPFRWGRGDLFVREVLEADLLAMRQVYRDRGWLDAVVEIDDLVFTDDRSEVDVHIVIDEGRPYTVASLDVEAVEQVQEPAGSGQWTERPAEFVFPKAELLELCQLVPGARFQQTTRARDQRALRDYYGARGYLSHGSLGKEASWEFLEPRLRFEPGEALVHVTYRVSQGRRRFVREILFEGATHTRDRVMRREVSMLPGEQADDEEILRSLNRLEDTGYFSYPADPFHPQPSYRFLPTDDPDTVDLQFELVEGRAADFNFGGAVSSDGGVSGFLRVSIPNFDVTDLPSSFGSTFPEIYRREAFRGAGQQLDIALSPGSVVDFWQLRFREPDLFRTHFDPYYLDLFFEERDRLYRSHDEGRTQFTPLLGRSLGDHWRVAGGLTWQHVEIDDVEDDEPVPDTLTRSEGSYGLFGLRFDLRYRDVLRRGSVTEGHSVLWSTTVYDDELAGDHELYTTELRGDLYVPLGDSTAEVRRRLKLSGWLGVADPFGDQTEVPYSERWFLGGSRSVRGFAFRGIGPNGGTDFPVGGETMARASLEYTIPLKTVLQPGTYRERELFNMSLFTDWGVLDPDAYELDPTEVRGSVGFGFGIMTPLGLLRFDFGFPVQESDGDDRRVFSFSFGI